jgi:hypothetical protein
VIYDATACPQDIAYPTDLGLLSKSREITEAVIDELHAANPLGKKPRTYREVAIKRYLKVVQNRSPSRKVIRKGIKSQLQYLRRNIKTIEKQLDGFTGFRSPIGGSGLFRPFMGCNWRCLKLETIR